MGIFSPTKITEKPVKIVVYLDVGHGNAKSAVIEINNNIPHILYYISGEHKIVSESSSEGLNEKALISLKEVIDETAKIIKSAATKNSRYVAEEVYCVLASPFYLSHTGIINKKWERPYKITEQVIKSLLDSGVRNPPLAHDNTVLGERTKVLHERIIDMAINGYHTIDPYQKSAENLQLSVFRTEIDEGLYKGIVRIIGEHTHAPLYVESFSLAAFVMLRNRIHQKDSFIFVTIGNEVSEVALVKKSVLTETVSFPFGKYSLAREIASKLKVTPEDAQSRISLYHDKKLHSEELTSIEEVVEGAQAEWFSYFERALLKLSEESALPPDIFIIVDTELKDIFGAIETNKSFASQTLVPSGFNVQTIDTALLADCCTFGLNIRFDTLLAVSAVFSASAKEAIGRLYPQETKK